MRLSEITNDCKKSKKRIDALYLQYTLNSNPQSIITIIDEIDKIYPTGYTGIDSSLSTIKNKLQEDFIQILISGELPK
jgi:predicted KAP-like P-loop ATPase